MPVIPQKQFVRTRSFRRLLVMVLSIVAICLGVGACDGSKVVRGRSTQAFQLNDGDYYSIAKVALDLIGRVRDVHVIVVPKEIDPKAREALSRQRKVISKDSLSSQTSLPRDYLNLRTFFIDDGQSMFEGDISTDDEDALPKGSVDCGLVFSVRFALVGDDWHSDSYKLTDCTRERVWYPKDAQDAGTQSSGHQ
jgi:hypothetical protein